MSFTLQNKKVKYWWKKYTSQKNSLSLLSKINHNLKFKILLLSVYSLIVKYRNSNHALVKTTNSLPCLPGGPRNPWGPGSPMPGGPGKPSGPCGPMGPSIPIPGGPGSPCTPLSPLGPDIPDGPGNPNTLYNCQNDHRKHLLLISQKSNLCGSPWACPTAWCAWCWTWPRWSFLSGNSLKWLKWISWTTISNTLFPKKMYCSAIDTLAVKGLLFKVLKVSNG